MNTAKITTALAALTLCGIVAAQTAASGGYFTDARDGKKYRTVKIGKHVWMAENLNFVADSSWCYINNEDYCRRYGRLYDWSTAMEVCPTGWRLPDTADWNGLARFVGGKRMIDKDGFYYWSTAGKKLKSKNGWRWCDKVLFTETPTDNYDFSALPGGLRFYNGTFGDYCVSGWWWSATEKDSASVLTRLMLLFNNDMVELTNAKKNVGMSVRCVKN